MAKKCPVCGQKISSLWKTKMSDGDICGDCARICFPHTTQTIDDVKRYWEINNERSRMFQPTQKLKSFASDTITIDAVNELFVFADTAKIKQRPIFYSFREVTGYATEVIGQKTVTKKKGGLTRALVGGAIAGPVGALIGSGTAKEETKVTGGISFLNVDLQTYAGSVRENCSNPPSGFVSFLDDCMALQKQDDSPIAHNCAADEILKFKILLDQGIITQNEFDAKKKELLGL